MPLYEYECEQGHRVDRLERFGCNDVVVCEECAVPLESGPSWSVIMRRLISVPAVPIIPGGTRAQCAG